MKNKQLAPAALEALDTYFNTKFASALDTYMKNAGKAAMQKHKLKGAALKQNEERIKKVLELLAAGTPIAKPIITDVWASLGSIAAPTSDQQKDGWGTGTLPESYFFNYLFNLIENYLLHINQQGICVWDTFTDYPINGLAKGSDGNVYSGLVSPNVAHNPVSDDGTNWEYCFAATGKPVAILEFKPTTTITVPATSSGVVTIILDHIVRNTALIGIDLVTGVITPRVPGVWRFTVCFQAQVGAGTNCGLGLYKNGAFIKTLDSTGDTSGVPSAIDLGFSGSVDVIANGTTDTFYLGANASGTGSGSVFGYDNTRANEFSNFSIEFVTT